jgi:hypothetical protein
MVPSHEPTLDEYPEMHPARELYHIIPISFTPKWKLELTNTSGAVLYRVTRRPTAPPCFQIQPGGSDDSSASLPVRVKAINGNARFTLYKEEERRYIIRRAVSTPQLLLQDASRQVLARFIPMTPEITILRTPIGTVARIRAKAHPSPIGMVIECKITQPQKWLLPVLLYAIIRFEEGEPIPLPETEPTEESTEVDTP